MLSHDEVWKAIDGLAERNGLSPSGLARRAGLDPTTFNKSKRFAADGRPRWPSTESVSKILAATGATMGELFRLDGPQRRAQYLSVPLLGQAHAGFGVVSTNGASPHPSRIISFPDTRHEPLYALTVTGDSMMPLYRDGDILFISRTADAKVGDRVVVKLVDAEVMVKVLGYQSDSEYAFHAINPNHCDVAFTHDQVEWVARIVYATQ
ncbi:MAG: helix-turn-helix transcriptional regulator [Pseudomonadota bacterium]